MDCLCIPLYYKYVGKCNGDNINTGISFSVLQCLLSMAHLKHTYLIPDEQIYVII